MQIPIVFIAFANDKVDYARYLRNLPKEQDGIRKALFEAQQAGLCEVVERANATLEQLLDVFQNKNYKDRIAIFHYGGHADGYQLLLEQLDGSHAAAHGGGLVSFFAKQNGLKLVFFNGCSTQQQALELSAAGVPAVVGTSQSINDDVATALSIRFYKGLGQGHTLERAWNEALDEIKLQHGDQNKGLYRLKKGETAPDQLPWNLIVREGAEQVKNWNLPEAVDNPLFGLPEVPRKFNLPDPPFLFLRRYERPHAEIFFGRSFYTRDLYNRITDRNAAPVILLYGQSGVGKSSLLDAGLLPRLEGNYEVRYIRRVKSEGLLGTLYLAVKDAWENAVENTGNEPVRHEEKIISAQKAQKIRQLESLAQDLDSDLQVDIQHLIKKLAEKKQEETPIPISEIAEKSNFWHEVGSLQKYWQLLEERYEKPLVLILDQVEEMLTQPNPKIKDEFEQLLEELRILFADPSFLPKGKIILSYRKEYHPEIEEGFKNYSIPRERVFLKHLTRKDIVEVVQGLTSNERLRKQYHLQVDPNLPVIVADDLLEDRDSSIAPVLQILLTKMWQRVEKDETPVFSIDLYQKLKGEGILMNDFFDQQIEKLREWNEEIETSGLALSVLNLHTTPIGTSKTVSQEDLFKRYEHLSEHLPALLLKFKELYLLTDAPNATSLGHDTLAPLVAREFQRSDRRGQRAARIIISKAVDFEKDEKNLIDPADLRIVENGLTGMRSLNEVEEKLLALSKKRRDRLQKIRRLVQAAFVFLFLLITAFFFYAQYERKVALEQKQVAEIQTQKADSASHIATVKEKEAVQKGIEAVKNSIIANQKQKEAIQSAKIAKQKEEEAQESAIQAQKSEQEAKISEKNALESKNEAEKQRQAARISTIDAEIARFASDFSSEESRYGTYKAKAKELAVQSIAISESPDLKIVLALNAYQLNDYAYTRLDQEISRIWRIYNNYLEKQVQEAEKSYARGMARNIKSTYERLKALSQNRHTSSQISEALRKAYLRNNPIKQDFLFDAESWELARLENQKIALNSKKGEIILTSLAENSPVLLPSPSDVYNLTPNQSFQYNSIVETPQGIYVGGKNGQIKFFGRGTISQVEQIGAYPSSILSMVYMPLISTLAFSYENKVVLQNTALNTKQLIEISQTSGVRHLTLIEENNNSYLLAADNNGNLSIWDSKQPEKGFVELKIDLGKSAIQTMYFFKNVKVLFVGNSKGEVFIISDFTIEKAKNGENFAMERNLWHRGLVKEVAISPNKQFLATAGFDGVVQMWRIGSDWAKHLKKQPDLTIQESSKILSLTFDTNSEYLIFNDEQKLRICPTNPTVFYKKLCLQKTRELTSAEWAVYMGDTKPTECVICK